MDFKNFFNMLLSKNSPGIQEVIFVSSSLHSTLRSPTHRISELPSLRYGPVGSKTTMTGPLVVSSRDASSKIHANESSRRAKSVSRFLGSGRNSKERVNGENRGNSYKEERRVRFTLPLPEGVRYIDDVDVSTPAARVADVNKPTYPSFLKLKSFSRSNIVFKPIVGLREGTSSENRGKYVKSRHNSTFKSYTSNPRQEGVNCQYRNSENYAGLSEDSEKNVGTSEKYAFNKHAEKYADFEKYAGSDSYILERRLSNFKRSFVHDRVKVDVPVSVSFSPGVRNRVHPTGRYIKGTLSPTQNATLTTPPCSPGGQVLLKAAQNGEEDFLRDHFRRGVAVGMNVDDLNAVDSSGRTVLSYIASNGSVDLLELILQIPGLDPNKPDNEGNTPLHFAAQAGQVECLNYLLSRCRGVDIDARNSLGFTPLMKAALQGRNKCAKLLLFAGANPTLRDNGRGFRADQWARFCGRYVCADVIEKHARQRLLERSTSYGNWGMEHEMGATVVNGKVIPVPPPVSSPPSNGLKSKFRKVFRTSSGPSSDNHSSARLITQLTSAALCASSPVLPTNGGVSPMVKSLIRPLTVPRLQVTLVNSNGELPNANDDSEKLPIEKSSNGTHEIVGNGTASKEISSEVVPNGCSTKGVGKHQDNIVPSSVVKPARSKKKK